MTRSSHWWWLTASPCHSLMVRKFVSDTHKVMTVLWLLQYECSIVLWTLQGFCLDTSGERVTLGLYHQVYVPCLVVASSCLRTWAIVPVLDKDREILNGPFRRMHLGVNVWFLMLCVGGDANGKQPKMVQREHKDLISEIRSQAKPNKLDVALPTYIPIQHKRKPRSLVLSPASDHLCATRYIGQTPPAGQTFIQLVSHL